MPSKIFIMWGTASGGPVYMRDIVGACEHVCMYYCSYLRTCMCVVIHLGLACTSSHLTTNSNGPQITIPSLMCIIYMYMCTDFESLVEKK